MLNNYPVFTLVYTNNMMMIEKDKINTDLEKFIKVFDPNKYKILRTGIEVRGISDIHRNITIAKQLIEKMKLKLSIRHTAEMTTYGGFEVLTQ